MKRPIVLLLLIAVVAGAIVKLSSMKPAPTESAAEPVQAEPDLTQHDVTDRHIAWFDGDVERGFAAAAQANKPIILYWGAEWCPPCNELKATIFKDPEFIAKTRLFVPVYIDGDEPGAQQYQDQFQAFGYPTLIILSAAGKEITRIPGGLDLERYAEVLDLALEHITPASQLVSRIMDEDYQPEPAELRLLAHYSWGQDRGQALAERDAANVFSRLIDITPDTLPGERTLFVTHFLESLTKVEEELPAEQCALARTMLATLLADDAAAAAASSFVAYSVKDVIEAISDEDSAQRTQLVDAWDRRLATAWQNETAPGAEHLRTLFGQIDVTVLRGEDASEELRQRIVTAVGEERSRATDNYARIAVVNSAQYLLRDSGQVELAEQLLREEMSDNVNSYYWMLGMASIAEKADRKDEAVDWMRQAYETADGLATRIQWGSVYISGLVRLSEESTAEIESAVDKVMTELAAQTNPVSGRNKGAIKRIAKALHGWSDNGEEPARILLKTQTRFGQMCQQSFAAEDEQASCLTLFDKPKEQSVG